MMRLLKGNLRGCQERSRLNPSFFYAFPGRKKLVKTIGIPTSGVDTPV